MSFLRKTNIKYNKIIQTNSILYFSYRIMFLTDALARHVEEEVSSE